MSTTAATATAVVAIHIHASTAAAAARTAVAELHGLAVLAGGRDRDDCASVIVAAGAVTVQQGHFARLRRGARH